MNKYLKYRLPVIIFWVFFELISFILFVLYNLPLLPWIHISIIVFSALVVIGVIDFSRSKRKHQLLIDRRLEMISPNNYIEQDFMDIIEDVEIKARLDKDKSISEYNDMVEYYTVWAHQIKTPIAALSLTVQNIEDDSLRQILQSELVRTEEYADMVMGYIRLQSSDSDFVFENIEINDVVRQEIRRMRTMFMSKKLGVSFDPDSSDGIKAVTDKRWISFALGQVLTNAIKYSSEGVISINVTNDYIEVKDQGIGIAQEDLPRIFEKGYTGYNGRSDKKSTGIGLYLVKKAMTSIGGDIEVSSQLGEGTTVKLIYKVK